MPGRNAALSPAQVLTGKAQFDRIFSARQSLASRYFRAHYLVNGQQCPRLGMAIGRRIDKRAVIRNRLRRQVRESCRLSLPVDLAIDVVVTARTDVVQADRAAVWRDLAALWQRLGDRLARAASTTLPVLDESPR